MTNHTWVHTSYFRGDLKAYLYIQRITISKLYVVPNVHRTWSQHFMQIGTHSMGEGASSAVHALWPSRWAYWKPPCGRSVGAQSLQVATAGAKLKDACFLEEKLWQTYTVSLKSRGVIFHSVYVLKLWSIYTVEYCSAIKKFIWISPNEMDETGAH